MPDPVRFELCVDRAAGLAAVCPGVDRIELCSGLEVGGLTPGPGLLQAAAANGVQTHVLIRPRAGNFTYDPDEVEVICADIRAVRALGLAGVVVGALRDGQLDMPALHQFKAAAGPLALTVHRAFDLLEDPLSALEQIIALGAVRLLTSGCAPTAPEGAEILGQLQRQAAGRIEVMAGCGVNSANLLTLAGKTGVTSFHASCMARAPGQGALAQLGFETTARRVDKQEVARILTALKHLDPSRS